MKIYASDYDGTIRVNETISKRNLEAIKQWREEGNVFGIVTGRSSETIKEELLKYHLEVDFLICNNGGVIYDKDQKLLKLHQIEFDKAMQLIEEIRHMECNSFVLNNGIERAKELVNDSFEDDKYGSYSSHYTVAKMIAERTVAQIVISVANDDIGMEIATYINHKYGAFMNAFPNVNCVDIVPYGVDKGTGLKYIQEYYQFDPQSIYVSGDAFNDLPMLKAYQSATLRHAYDAIKKECTVVVDEIADYIRMIRK